MSKYIVGVEGAIYREGKYLLIRRSKYDGYALRVVALVGGKVEGYQITTDILEETLKREIKEEVGVEVEDKLHYVESQAFVINEEIPVIYVVFLCNHKSREPQALDEVWQVFWMSYEEVEKDHNISRYVKESLDKAESLRVTLHDFS